MKATWFRDPDESDCPDAPYAVHLHRGEKSIELTRCRSEDKARVVCSALNSGLRLDVASLGDSLYSLFTGDIHAPDEIAGFHPLTQTL